MPTSESSEKGNGRWRGLPRAWFYLTPNERLALAVVFGLLLLGLLARFWHLSHEKSEPLSARATEQGQRP
ncbi:MAG: hypothetical protein HYV35_04450 [Lentisphaerae bacterium]|nr:hypothetical protein [Lentisphaerota bacterium]